MIGLPRRRNAKTAADVIDDALEEAGVHICKTNESDVPAVLRGRSQ